MTTDKRPLAVVTGASAGIGLELAKCCAEKGYDLLIAADEPMDEVMAALVAKGANVESVQADLATPVGVEELYRAIRGRPVEALLANAVRGLGHAFLDQEY